MEYIISKQRLDDIQKQAWHAGHSNIEPYQCRCADGEEIVRCRDCGMINETLAFPEDWEEREPLWLCCKHGRVTGPNGYCAWGERSE